jgi:chemotaxis protein MotB
MLKKRKLRIHSREVIVSIKWKSAMLALIAAALLLGAAGCTRMESTYVGKVQEADNLRQELALLQQRHDALVEENKALKDKVEELSGELAAVTRDRNRLAGDLDFMTGQRDKMSADIRSLEGALQAKSDSLSQTIVELRRKIAELEIENRRLQMSVADLQKAQEEKVRKVSATYESLLDKMKSEIDRGQVTISELKGKLTVNMVDAILFDSGRAEVKPEGLAVLRKVVSILKDVDDKAIRIEGHTDNARITGLLAKTFPTNWELSAARALNVTRYLQDQGIDPAVLSAVAYGEYKPVADNDTPEGMAKNRRIEIILIPREDASAPAMDEAGREPAANARRTP